jgi:hypothetical protein
MQNYLVKKSYRKGWIVTKKCLNLNIIKKIRDMAKKNSNSGFERQGAVLGQFARDAKAPISSSSAVAVAMAGKEQRDAYRAEQARKAAEKPRMSFYVPK